MKIKIPTVSFVFLTVWMLSEPYITTFAVLISAFLHEAGHLIAIHILRIHISTITIYPLGADIHLCDTVSYIKHILISLAGPLTNILTIFACKFFINSISEPYIFIAEHIAASSLSLAVINLLPIKGFDGGNILQCIMSLAFSDNIAHILYKLTSCITLISLWLISLYLLLTISSGISLFALCAFMFSTTYITK